LDKATGTLFKALIIPDFDIVNAIEAGEASVNSQVLFCEGIVIANDECDEPTDAAVVVHGGYDTDVDFGNFESLEGLLGSFGAFLFTADVSVGDYTICTEVSISGDLDDDDLTPDMTLDTGLNCEHESSLQIVGTPDVEGSDPNFELVEGQITVHENMATLVVNVFASVDVFVLDDEIDQPIADAEVCLYEDGDLTGTPVCITTDANGMARLFHVADGTYTLNTVAAGYDAEMTTLDYTIVGDVTNGRAVDDALTADVIQSLVPSGG
jgi:hypothetical protein